MPDASITALVQAFSDGDRGALDRLMPLVYRDLQRLARNQVRRGGPRVTLDTGVLVHEAYMKMLDQKSARPVDRGHFLAICSRAMRQVVIDHARQRQAAKRGGGERPVTFDEAAIAVDEQAVQLLEINDALERLEKRDERLARVVECRFFAGLTEDETAAALGVNTRTVQRDWRRARAWLLADLDGTGGAGTAADAATP